MLFRWRSGVLCSKCESRLESGSTARDDVEAAIKLSRLADRSENIDKFTLLRGVQVDGDFVLVLMSPEVPVLRGDSPANKIEGEFERRVRFV